MWLTWDQVKKVSLDPAGMGVRGTPADGTGRRWAPRTRVPRSGALGRGSPALEHCKPRLARRMSGIPSLRDTFLSPSRHRRRTLEPAKPHRCSRLTPALPALASLPVFFSANQKAHRHLSSHWVWLRADSSDLKINNFFLKHTT